jgi:hypothetical protein
VLYGKSMKFLIIFSISLLLLMMGSQGMIAQPRLVHHFNSHMVSNVLFIGVPGPTQEGFVSTFDHNLNRTSDGGKTWEIVYTSSANYFVTSLTFKDSLEGWAGIGQNNYIHSTDGGLTWNAFSIPGGSGSIIHYVPGSGYLFAGDYYDEVYSSDHGNTWLPNTRGAPYFAGDSEIVTTRMWFDSVTSVSSDGGITWLDGPISNAFATGIGKDLFSFGAKRGLYVSLSFDLGLTWQKRGIVADFDCDSDCCEWNNASPPFVLGQSGAIYTVDDEYAIYVSTDTGWTWQAICLPTGAHNYSPDENFVDVSEPLIYIAEGQDLFAYPDRPPRSGLAFTEGPNPFVRDTCSGSATEYIIANYGDCVNDVEMSISGSPAFTVEGYSAGIFTSGDTDYYAISYHSNSVGFDTAQLHIHYYLRCQNEWLDTIITLYGQTIGTSSLDLCLNQSTIMTSAGDTINIPVYFNGVAILDSTSISVPFGIDTNVLRPIGFYSSISGITTDTITSLNGIENVILQSSQSLILKGDTMLGMLRCIVYLVDTLATFVLLVDSNLTLANSPCATLSLCSDSVNILINGCGDQTLLEFMKTWQVPLGIQSIVPNPATDAVQISFINPTSSAISYQVFDALGQTRLKGVSISDALSLDVSSLPQGIYFFRATNGSGFSASSKVVIVR